MDELGPRTGDDGRLLHGCGRARRLAAMLVITSVLVTRAASAQETPLPVGARVRVTLAPAAAGAHVVGRLERASHDSLVLALGDPRGRLGVARGDVARVEVSDHRSRRASAIRTGVQTALLGFGVQLLSDRGNPDAAKRFGQAATWGAVGFTFGYAVGYRLSRDSWRPVAY